MPELPDLTVYIERLRERIAGTTLDGIRVAHPFLLRTVLPRPSDFSGARVVAVFRLGKRIVIELDGERFVAMHLMKAGRLRWLDKNAKIPGKMGLCAFDFERGSLVLTEAGSKRRASLHLLDSRAALRALDAGGVELLGIEPSAFRDVLVRENHTLKRALSDPRLFAGVGNAYSDEILHRAKLSPLAKTHQLDDDEIARLHAAVQRVLSEWTERLRAHSVGAWPDKVTAFHDEMAVHGRFRLPCPVCGAPVQRIVYAENETNYCAKCQTDGRVLADRALSRLLKGDWPKNIDEMDLPTHALKKD